MKQCATLSLLHCSVHCTVSKSKSKYISVYFAEVCILDDLPDGKGTQTSLDQPTSALHV